MLMATGVTGGSASGKTTVCKKIMEKLKLQQDPSDPQPVLILSQVCRTCNMNDAQDRFYRPLTPTELQHVHDYNFDSPSMFAVSLTFLQTEAFDYELMMDILTKLRERKVVDLPVYDFATHSRQVWCFD